MNFDEMQENPDIRATKNGAVASEKNSDVVSPQKCPFPWGELDPM